MPFMPRAAVVNAQAGLVRLYDRVATGALASFDVTGIVQDYAHLQFVLQGRGDTVAGAVQINLFLNNDTGANYDFHYILGTNTSISTNGVIASASPQIGNITAANATANFPGMIQGLIPNYAGAVFFKQVMAQEWDESSAAVAGQSIFHNSLLWKSAAAITRITAQPAAGNFVAGSRFTVYGMA